MDKQKQIEEMVETMANWAYRNGMLWHEGHAKLLAEALVENGYRKIPEGAVLTDKEYKRYERIEKTIKLAKMYKANGYEVKNGKLYYYSNMLGGCEIEFKDLQEICDMANHYNEEFWGLDQRLTFWQGKAEDIRKETAEKFAEMLKEKFAYDIERCKAVDEICKELAEGKNGYKF